MILYPILKHLLIFNMKRKTKLVISNKKYTGGVVVENEVIDSNNPIYRDTEGAKALRQVEQENKNGIDVGSSMKNAGVIGSIISTATGISQAGDKAFASKQTYDVNGNIEGSNFNAAMQAGRNTINPVGSWNKLRTAEYSGKDKRNIALMNLVNPIGAGIMMNRADGKIADAEAKRVENERIASILSANQKQVNINVPTFEMGGTMGIQGDEQMVDNIEGQLHENGGTNIGNLAEAQKGETKKGNYIYSDDIKITKRMAKDYDIPNSYIGKSVSEVSKKLQEKYGKRSNDSMDSSVLEEELDILRDVQEEAKQEMVQNAMKTIQSVNPELASTLMRGGQGQGNGQGQMRMDGSGEGMGKGKQLMESQLENNQQLPQFLEGGDIPPIWSIRGEGSAMPKGYYFNKSAGRVMNIDETPSEEEVDLINNPPAAFKGDINYLNPNQKDVPNVLAGYKTNQFSTEKDRPETGISNIESKKVNIEDRKEQNKQEIGNYGNAPFNPFQFSGGKYIGEGTNNSNIGKLQEENLNPEKKYADDSVKVEKGNKGNGEIFNSTNTNRNMIFQNLGNAFDVVRGTIGLLKPEKKLDRVTPNLVTSSLVDPENAVQNVNSVYASAIDSVRQNSVSAGNYLANRLALASQQAKDVLNTRSQYDTNNAATINQTRAMNSQILGNTQQLNVGQSNLEEQINQQERDVAANMLQAGLSNAGEIYGGVNRDENARAMELFAIQFLGSKDYTYKRLDNGLYKMRRRDGAGEGIYDPITRKEATQERLDELN